MKTAEVVMLSDLNRADARALEDAWQGLPEETRVAVVRLMNQLAEDRIDLHFGRALRVALTDASPVARQLAVNGLWEDTGPDLVERFIQLLQDDPSPDVRAAAAQQLSRYADAGAGSSDQSTNRSRVQRALAQVLLDENAPLVVRRRLLEAIAGFGSGPETVAFIERAYDSDEPGMRATALYAMGRSMDARWVSYVAAELESDDAELRYEAARACGMVGDEAAVPALATTATDRDAEVRQAAITALGEIGGPSAIQALRRLMMDGGPESQDLIEEALDDAVGGATTLRALG